MAREPNKKSIRKSRRSSRRRLRKAKKTSRASNPQRYDPRLEQGLRYMRSGDSLAAAARKMGTTPSRLRRYATKTGVVSRRDGKWVFKRDRRFRRMPLYTNGTRAVITVHNSTTAKRIGQYMNAVKRFFETEDVSLLAPFQGQSVPDVLGKRYVFETRPNVLFRLDASGVEPFELVYAIVKPE